MIEKNIGVFVGKFLPAHIGHINQIKKCLDDCDELIVVVADSKKRSQQICHDAGIKTIYAKTRLKWLKKCLKTEKHIKFCLLNEGMLEAFPNHLEDWKKKFSKRVPKFNVWFVDKNYLEVSKKYFPEYEFIGFDRSEIDISATEIRTNLKENLKFIVPSAQRTFEKYLKNNELKIK